VCPAAHISLASDARNGGRTNNEPEIVFPETVSGSTVFPRRWVIRA
jgi:hypothetical protein